MGAEGALLTAAEAVAGAVAGVAVMVSTGAAALLTTVAVSPRSFCVDTAVRSALPKSGLFRAGVMSALIGLPVEATTVAIEAPLPAVVVVAVVVVAWVVVAGVVATLVPVLSGAVVKAAESIGICLTKAWSSDNVSCPPVDNAPEYVARSAVTSAAVVVGWVCDVAETLRRPKSVVVVLKSKSPAEL
jgi:hypothetical protein